MLDSLQMRLAPSNLVSGFDLSQWTEELSQILRKQLGLLYCSEVSR
jgi:hypothetical protein